MQNVAKKKSTHRTKGLIEQIRDYVRDSDLPQNEIAERLGVDKSRVSRFIAGKSALSAKNLDALFELLGLKLTKARR